MPLLREGSQGVIECYDFTKELEALNSHFLALFKFTICLANSFPQNIRTFVILLHDFPLPVEETEIYSVVKKWRNPLDIQEALDSHSVSLPPAYPLELTSTEVVRFFRQSFYREKPKEEARLLCWGATKERVGFFSFKLPEVVSTRFISLVVTGVHSTFKTGNEAVSVDVMKFIPHGVVLPCL